MSDDTTTPWPFTTGDRVRVVGCGSLTGRTGTVTAIYPGEPVGMVYSVRLDGVMNAGAALAFRRVELEAVPDTNGEG